MDVVILQQTEREAQRVQANREELGGADWMGSAPRSSSHGMRNEIKRKERVIP